jgi:hypothetical protein
MVTMCALAGMGLGSSLFFGFLDHFNPDSRIELWKNALKLSWINQPSIGFGLGNWAAIYPGLIKSGGFAQGWIRLHNSFVHGFVEMGIAFPLLIIGYIVNIIRRASVKAVLPIAALGSITVAMCSNSLFRMNALNAMIAVIWFAVLENKLREA